MVGSLIAADHFPQNGPAASSHTDTITLTDGAPAGDWLMLVQLGGYPFANGGGLPIVPTPSVDNIPFEELDSTAFAFSAPPNTVEQWNEAVHQLAHVVAGIPNTAAYVDNTYPNLAYSAPGLLASPVAAADTMDIQWVSPPYYWEEYAAFIVGIHAHLDMSGDQAIWLEGSSPDNAGSTNNIASGTTSADAVTHASTSAAAGHGSLALVAVSWNDIAQTPSITSGWTLLASYADTTTGWAGLVAGKEFPAADTATYTFNATFGSSVKSETVTDTWQTTSEGLHVWVTN